MAEREGFEPPCRLLGKTLSRRPRYDHFGTSPCLLRSEPSSSLRARGRRSRGDFPPALACGRRRYVWRSRSVAFGDFAPPLAWAPARACGRRRCLTSLGGASFHSPPPCARPRALSISLRGSLNRTSLPAPLRSLG